MRYKSTSEKPETTLSVTVQEFTKNFTFIILSLLSFRGLIEFFEANQGSTLRSAVTFVTEPIVQLFYQSFPPENAAVSLATFAAIIAISVLAGIVYIAAGSVHRIEQLKLHKSTEQLNSFKH